MPFIRPLEILHGRFTGWLLIDEVSMLPAGLAPLLENLATARVKFVLFGDFNQLLPPCNRWRHGTVTGEARVVGLYPPFLLHSSMHADHI